MSAPTVRQLRILRLLAAGVRLENPDRVGGRYRLTLDGVQTGLVVERTLVELVVERWITYKAPSEYVLTREGRARAEVKTFVRAFAEAQER